ncbi:MAG: proline--tRNA ligase [Proteobacteria bacterium]|nr:proline--tRNA ligase [Pseudomonadota bacterium]
MRFSTMLLPTLKETPADADVISQKLMVRAGMIRKVAAGIYDLLPLGVRVIRNVEKIIREEMNRSGAQEILMPTVLPAELWSESGRWEEYGAELLRLKDRHGRDFCLGPTHEEAVTDIVRRDVKSYKGLPLNLYQIQGKFRDEIRPRFGLMRGREFIMKDAYSFHATDESAEEEYVKMRDTYSRIFERCGLTFRAVEADAGNIGGNFSHEFMVMADTGEDAIAVCDTCKYAANLERAEIRPYEAKESGEDASTNEVDTVTTPGVKCIEEVSVFLDVSKETLIKTLIYNTDAGPVAALVRGDAELNELKLKRVLGAEFVELADDKTVEEITGAPVGFAGPVGLKIRIVADHAIRGMVDSVAGANEANTHLLNVNQGRDFEAEYGDLRNGAEGDGCPRCAGTLSVCRGIEVGHIFKLGTKYSVSMGANFLDENGKAQPMIMGCYGIGVGRVAAAAIEQNHDEAGIVWPAPLSPFDVEILPIKIADLEVRKAAFELYTELTEAGLDCLIDDRKERAGVKFKDADLIGIPLRVTLGDRNLKEGNVEFKDRGTGEVRLVAVADAAEEVLKSIRGAGQ